MTLLSTIFDPSATSNVPDSARPDIHLDFRTDRHVVGDAPQTVLIIDARWADKHSHKAVFEIPVTFDGYVSDDTFQFVGIDVGFQPEALVTRVNNGTKRVEQVPLSESMRTRVIAEVLEVATRQGYWIDETQLRQSLDPERYVDRPVVHDALEVGTEAGLRAQPNGGEFQRFRSPLSDLPELPALSDLR